jgi:hypothetical protein
MFLQEFYASRHQFVEMDFVQTEKDVTMEIPGMEMAAPRLARSSHSIYAKEILR